MTCGEGLAPFDGKAVAKSRCIPTERIDFIWDYFVVQRGQAPRHSKPRSYRVMQERSIRDRSSSDVRNDA
jgi:hypothetical protein